MKVRNKNCIVKYNKKIELKKKRYNEFRGSRESIMTKAALERTPQEKHRALSMLLKHTFFANNEVVLGFL